MRASPPKRSRIVLAERVRVGVGGVDDMVGPAPQRLPSARARRRCRRSPAGRARADGGGASPNSGAAVPSPRSRERASRPDNSWSLRERLDLRDDPLARRSRGCGCRSRSRAGGVRRARPSTAASTADGRAARAADCRPPPSRDPRASRSAVDLPAPDRPVTSRMRLGAGAALHAGLSRPALSAVSTLIGADASMRVERRSPAARRPRSRSARRRRAGARPRGRGRRTGRPARRRSRRNVDDADAAHLDLARDRRRRARRAARRRPRRTRCNRR